MSKDPRTQQGRESADALRALIDQYLPQDDVRKLLARLNEAGREHSTDTLADVLGTTSALLEITRRLSDSLDLDVVLGRLVELMRGFLRAEHCAVLLHDPASDELFTRSAADARMREIRFPAGSGIAGAVLRTGQAVHVADVRADARFDQDVDGRPGVTTRNIACVPIRHGHAPDESIVGVALVSNRLGGDFDERDVQLLASLIAHAAAPLVNCRLHEQIVRARQEERRMIELTSALTSELNLVPLLRKIMETVKLTLDSERATLFIHDPKTDTLWALVSEDAAMATIRFPSNKGIAGAVFTTRETINIADAYADPRFNQDVDRATGFRTRTILCMPVLNKQGKAIAVTQVLNRTGGPFRPVDEERLRTFSTHASIAIENAMLFDEVNRVKNYNESILESMSNGVLSVDQDGVVLKANRSALRLLRLEHAPEEVVGRHERELFSGSNAWISQAVERVQSDGDPDVSIGAELVLPLNTEGGAAPGIAAVNLTVAALTDGKDVRAGALIVFEDITIEKRLKSTMARYMSKEVADRLLEEGEEALGGRLQKATLLFTDIRSFTSISERMGPQATVSLLNDYFGIMVDVLLDKGGILDKYIGDAIMAVFGVPFAAPDDADRAVGAAVDMLKALAEFNAAREARGDEAVLMGIGINTDEIVSGNIGSLKRMDYTVIGDGVNLASRLEGANKLYGTQVLVSEFTVRELTGSYRLREVDRMRVKGKSQPVGVFEVLDHLDAVNFPRVDEALRHYQAALERYRERDWKEARLRFEQVLAIRPADGPSRLYVGRCEYFVANPPAADWAGVWVLKDK